MISTSEMLRMYIYHVRRDRTRSGIEADREAARAIALALTLRPMVAKAQTTAPTTNDTKKQA